MDVEVPAAAGACVADQQVEHAGNVAFRGIEGGAELLLTEMKDDELLKLVALDIQAVSLE